MKSGLLAVLFVLECAALLACGAGSVFAQTFASPARIYAGGTVKAITFQSDGKVIIGGSFTHVHGVARNNLARLNVDGSLDAAWDPNPNDVVNALAFDGDNLYVGGNFTSIAGRTANRVARILPGSNAVADAIWDPSLDGPVYAFLPDGAGSLYIAGGFSAVGAVTRRGIAKVATGSFATLDAWNPNLSVGASVHVVGLSGFVYLGGSFSSVGGTPRTNLARVLSSGASDTWAPNANGTVYAITSDGAGNLIVGGDFTSVGGQSRNRLAKVSQTTGAADAWNPNATHPVYSLRVDGSLVYAGGAFSAIGGVSRSYLARIDNSGAGAVDTTWTPGADDTVRALFVVGSRLFAGGAFNALNAGPAPGFVVFDKGTLALEAGWPVVVSPGGSTSAIAHDAAGRTVIGGRFAAASNPAVSRRNIARLNADGSLDLAWNPSPNRFVESLAIDADGTVFAGGSFTAIGGQARNRIAKLSATTGAADPGWNPNSNHSVTSLVLDGAGRLYVGGVFTSIGGAARFCLARIPTSGSGAADPSWDPSPNDSVFALALDGPALYVGGLFSTVGGQARAAIAKVSTAGSGALDTTWVPDVGNTVFSLALDTTSIFVGGTFSNANGLPRHGVAKLSKAAPATVDASWNPGGGAPFAMAVDGRGGLYLGSSPSGPPFRIWLARVSSSGTGAVDASWSTEVTNGLMRAISLDAQGNVHVGGDFSVIASQTRPGYAVLTSPAGAGAPAITSASTASFTVLLPNAFTIGVTGSPAPTLSLSGTLPAGVGFNASSREIAGTPASGSVGSYTVTLTASNLGGVAQQAFTLTVAKSSQSISFENPGTRNFSKVPFAAGAVASSALAVAYTSHTPDYCAVNSGGSIIMLRGGTCTIAANQPGNGDFHAAAQVQQTFEIVSTAPSAAAIVSITRTVDSVTIAFNPPESNGGVPITGYMATCNPGGLTQITSTSPVTITGLVPGQAYTCTIVATNSVGSGPPAIPPSGGAALTSASVLAFGGQSMGMSSPAVPFSITNNGLSPVTITGISLTSQYSASNTCTTLAPGASCVVNVTFTPVATAGPLNMSTPVNGTLTIIPSTGQALVVALTGLAEKSFITHYYRAILNRAPDDGGKTYWGDEAMRLAALGANINEVWFVLAGYFFNSPEYLARNKTNTQFVTDLYNTFFNRAPDEGGLTYWTGQISAGLPRDVILFQFMFSGEFRAFANNIFGNTAARPEVDMVVDFYRGIMNRLPDSGGFNYWVARLRAAQCQNSAASVYQTVEDISSFFMHGGEYAQRGRTNTQFTTDMYYSFLRRGGDLDGVRYWINELNTGVRSRENVRQYFLASPEFGARVQAVIAAACVN